MSEAVKWLYKGPIWRHPETGEIAGPVVPEVGGPNNQTSIVGPIDRAVSWAILALYIVFVLGAGYTAFQPGPRNPASSAFVTSALPMMLIVGVVAGLVTLGLRNALSTDSYKVRGIAGAAIVLALWYFRVPGFVLLLGLALAVASILGRYYSPGLVNARMVAAGYRKVEAKPKEATAPRQTMPKNYTGTWSAGRSSSEWVNGELTGVYFPHSVPNHTGDGTVIQRFLRPVATEKYPFGWVFDPSMPGYVPRQSDPYASPVADEISETRPSEAYGKPSVIPEADLRAMGAAHAQGREA